MSLDTLEIDVYQLTTLVAHADAGRLHERFGMAFFFRQLPPTRRYVVACGLRSILEHAAQMAFEKEEVDRLRSHPLLGPALAKRPQLVKALSELQGFHGEIDALPEGTFAFAGPGLRSDGKPLKIGGVPIFLYTPLLQVRTDLLRAKLIETPWLSRLNYMSMVASKACRVVEAAQGKPVVEFGARRTHPAAAVDASYAAYLGGCAATSNLAAYYRYGVPAMGTMDHFFIQAAERPQVPIRQTEAEAFALFARAFPDAMTALVDTYEVERAIKEAVHTVGSQLKAIRLDSDVTLEAAQQARRLLDELGARETKIFASDRLDEFRVRELREVVDLFGVGENITCSPDVPTGVGAVAKLVVNGQGKPTMKISGQSGKFNLPGELQVYRFDDHDLVALADEPSGTTPLLRPVWRGDRPVPGPTLAEARQEVRRQLAAMPTIRALEPGEPTWPLVASDRLVDTIEQLYHEAML